ncbi:conserved hypothetical protein [Xenorhabdus bovienii str. kraussei Quebec]|uniref:Uncharacterized protein n=1 Tax=Xenorhabdus bovienii str. kraussei Quebec TaxID=1398203 RepID=A0A077PIB4_XENBV|nr:conserved hypothetical protein [Xenorhabdus bovienii str. kraussei Quebec]
MMVLYSIELGGSYFLVDDAPDFLLTQVFTLDVYEGSNFVAIVEVF